MIKSARVKRSFYSLGIAAIVYVLLYIPNSMLGGYYGPVGGRTLYNFGLSMRTAYVWEPRFGYVDFHDSTALGKVLFPLVRLDQRYAHPVLDLGDKNAEARLFAGSNSVRWHPLLLQEVEDAKIRKALWRSRCFDEPEFCLESTVDFHSKADIHFMAVILCDKYQTNALRELDKFAEALKDPYLAAFQKQHVHTVRIAVENLISTNHPKQQ